MEIGNLVLVEIDFPLLILDMMNMCHDHELIKRKTGGLKTFIRTRRSPKTQHMNLNQNDSIREPQNVFSFVETCNVAG